MPGFTPRVHNLVSYLVAMIVLPIALLFMHKNDQDITKLIIGMWVFHFLRRSVESAFIHIFSKPFVGAIDSIIEYVYYWGFASWIAYDLAHTHFILDLFSYLGFCIWVIAELGNFKSHWMLRQLRPANSKAKVIPAGFLFEFVSCPHYFFEILSWLGFFLITKTISSFSFFLVGSIILVGWARQRHDAYLSTFSHRYPSHRKIIIPFLF